MIAFTYRPHWYSLRKATISRTSFDECTTDEVLAIFRFINSPAVMLDDKCAIADWVEACGPSEKFPLKNLCGFSAPADMLRGMSIGQWANIERACFDYSQSPTVETKARLLAALFLKPGERFTDKTISLNEKRFRRVPVYRLLAAIHCWSLVRAWVYKRYPYVFPTRKTDEEVQPTAPEYGKLIISLANGNSDKDIEDIFHSSLHNILARLEMRIEEQKKKPGS